MAHEERIGVKPAPQLAEDPQTLRVGLLQTAPTFGHLDANIDRISGLRSRLGDLDVVLTPELALNGYGFGPASKPNALLASDPRLSSLGLGTAAMGIGFAESNPSGKPHNSYAVVDSGSMHLQRKLHPVASPPWNEHLVFAAGDRLNTPTVRGAKCAVIICNDMWHPVVPWLAAHGGAEVLIVPVASAESAVPGQVQRTWALILEHSATLLQCYVIFINRCGTDSGARFWGGSRILGPDGATIVELDDSEGTAEATLDLGMLRRLRARTPVLAEARTDFVLIGISGLSPRGLPENANSDV
ncbi:nitrilase-related carbon-nitrogen hydrolase [Cryobacterium sp. Y50]|uniref:nitrilase-related carbon-nitrogen hydrolase n=1 Tax=Cryobacterium sp. Y50 TaxID=2048286 RepID=UPI000CE3EB25|nr:nitrilase-related carbon-nitrogen hydrolase [Cryobacterium sp. Y50]